MRRSKINVAVLEALPSRRLLAVALSGEQLFISGTEASDHILVAPNSADASKIDVNVNGEAQTFDRTAISSIFVIGGAGRDHIIIDDAITLPTTLMGNGGSDLLIGGSGDDAIYGGSGKDRIVGGVGNDLISGGSSRDQVAGGDGTDTILGGAGDDAIDSGAGNDSVIGGLGDDYVDAGAGNDSVNGGADYDSIMGGSGDDDLSGGKGDDDIDGQTGVDSSTGGAGDDAFAYNDNADDQLVDKTDGSDRVYSPVTMDFIPEEYHHIFGLTFPNSEPVGVRVNDDHSFVLLYRFNGDGSVYHAYFTYQGEQPFDTQMIDGVDLVSYEVAPVNLPPLTRAEFETNHPDVVIKDVFADHDGGHKFAMIRYVTAGGESKVVRQDWLGIND